MKKKVILFAKIAILIVLLTVVISSIVIASNYYNHSTPIENQYNIQIDQNKFLLKCSKDRFLNGNTYVSVYVDGKKSYRIYSYRIYSYKLIDKEYTTPKVDKIYNKDGLARYEWNGGGVFFMTYQTLGNQEIKAFPIHDSTTTTFKDAELLYPVAKERFKAGNLNDIRLFGELLLQYKDTDAIETFKRFATNEFTGSELAISSNAEGDYTPTDIYYYSQSILQQYKIPYKQ